MNLLEIVCTTVPAVIGVLVAIYTFVSAFTANKKMAVIISSVVFPCVIIFIPKIIAFVDLHWKDMLMQPLWVYLLVLVLIVLYSTFQEHPEYAHIEYDEAPFSKKIIRFLGDGLNLLLIFMCFAPTLAWFVNTMCIGEVSALGNSNEYILFLSQRKISLETYKFLIENLWLSLFYIIKAIEIILYISISLRSLKNLYMVNCSKKSPVNCRHIKFTVIIFMLLIIFSSNIYVGILYKLSLWFWRNIWMDEKCS